LREVSRGRNRYNLKKAIEAGLSILERLEEFHNLGNIHCDLKPNNIMFGTGDLEDKLYLIDFGVSKRYLDSSGKHIPYQKVPFEQNEWFASPNAFLGHHLTRRDDIIQMVYCIMFSLDGFRDL
jgi:serine/threonine protein kinase